MNNKEYIAELSRQTGFTQEYTQKLVQCVTASMAQSFDEGEQVNIPTFGTFEVKKRLERIIVNPSTGGRMMVPPKLVLSFKPSTNVKVRLNQTEEENS